MDGQPILPQDDLLAGEVEHTLLLGQVEEGVEDGGIVRKRRE